MKIRKAWCPESVRLGSTSIHVPGGRPLLHGAGSSEAQAPSGPFPMYIFIWLLTRILYNK